MESEVLQYTKEINKNQNLIKSIRNNIEAQTTQIDVLSHSNSTKDKQIQMLLKDRNKLQDQVKKGSNTSINSTNFSTPTRQTYTAPQLVSKCSNSPFMKKSVSSKMVTKKKSTKQTESPPSDYACTSNESTPSSIPAVDSSSSSSYADILDDVISFVNYLAGQFPQKNVVVDTNSSQTEITDDRNKKICASSLLRKQLANDDSKNPWMKHKECENINDITNIPSAINEYQQKLNGFVLHQLKKEVSDLRSKLAKYEPTSERNEFPAKNLYKEKYKEKWANVKSKYMSSNA